MRAAVFHGPQDVRTRMLEALGFTYPKALRDAFPNEFGGQLSDEKVDAVWQFVYHQVAGQPGIGLH